LLEAIWPGEDPQRTIPRFWQSVTDARKALGDGWVRDDERYELDHTQVHIDLDQLDQLLTTSDPAEEQRALETAPALWHRQPLAGSDCPWADGNIHRLYATLLELLSRVGAIQLAAGDPRGAVQTRPPAQPQNQDDLPAATRAELMSNEARSRDGRAESRSG
jgi:two-component SAPR family response regulator